MEELLVTYPWIKMVLQLLLAAGLGGILGVERNYIGKDAGTRTFALISLGACLFTIISFNAFEVINMTEGINYDPGRIAAQIVSGIGFIGMAVIFRRGSDIEGITTAVSIWVSAAIGMAVGLNFYTLAISATVIAFLIQGILRTLNLEGRLEGWHKQREKNAKKS